MPIRVVVAEDNYLASEAIARVLEREEGIEIVGTCADLETLREVVNAEQPDVVVSDIQMPPAQTDEGIRFASELRATHPGVGVVILSQHAEPLYATQLLAEGSDGRAYLLKDRVKDRSDLTRAVREVAEGGSVVDARIIELLVTAKRGRDQSGFQQLTPREREILGLVAEGWSNAAVGRQLGITTRAVERHIHAIFSKLELGDSAEHSRRVKATLLYLADQVG